MTKSKSFTSIEFSSTKVWAYILPVGNVENLYFFYEEDQVSLVFQKIRSSRQIFYRVKLNKTNSGTCLFGWIFGTRPDQGRGGGGQGVLVPKYCFAGSTGTGNTVLQAAPVQKLQLCREKEIR